MLTESQLIEKSQSLKLLANFNESLSLLTEDQILAREMFLAEGKDPLLEVGLADAWEWAKALGVGALGLIKKVGMPITAAYEVWRAWEDIKEAKAKNLPREQFKSQVAKIIAKAVGQFGLVYVGALAGGAIAGVFGLTTGPGAIIAAIAGAIGGAYYFSKNVDEMVEGLVDLFYPEGKEKPTDPNAPSTNTNTSSTDTSSTNTTSTSTTQSGSADDSIVKIQTALKADGHDLGKWRNGGIDGQFGKDTMAALQAYKKKRKLESTPDLEIIMQLAGIDANAAAAVSAAQIKEMQQLSESEKMAALRQRIAELDEVKLDERSLRSFFRHGADSIGVTTKGMGHVKDLGGTVTLKPSKNAKPQETWTYDKKTGEYHSNTGQRKSPEDMKTHKEKYDADIAAKAAAKVQPGETVRYPATGPSSQNYTYDGKQWRDASGNVVTDKAMITHLSGEAVAARSVAPKSTTAPGSSTPNTPGTNIPNPPGGPVPPVPPKTMTGKAKQSWDALKTSKFGQFLSNGKVLTLLAALGTAGYLFNRDGNIFSGNGSETPVTPPVTSEPNQSGSQDTTAPNATAPNATAPNATAPNATTPGISDKEANNLMKQNILPANMQTPAGEFKFTPEQEKWLGGANRQDPYILSRMPGEKPPVSYFTDPEDQKIASGPGMQFSKDAAPVAAVNPKEPVAKAFPVAEPKPLNGKPMPITNETVVFGDDQVLARIVDLARR